MRSGGKRTRKFWKFWVNRVRFFTGWEVKILRRGFGRPNCALLFAPSFLIRVSLGKGLSRCEKAGYDNGAKERHRLEFLGHLCFYNSHLGHCHLGSR